MKSEKKLTEDVSYSEALTGSVLFRNAVGFMNGFAFGLSPGSSDEIGWKETIITPEMIEAKKGKRYILKRKFTKKLHNTF